MKSVSRAEDAAKNSRRMGPGDFEVMIEGRGRVNQDVIALFNRALVARARGEMIAIAA